MSDALDEERGLCTIGYTRDLLYNLGVADSIWSLSLKHDIQTWFVTLTELMLHAFLFLLRDLVSVKGNEWRFMSDHCFYKVMITFQQEHIAHTHRTLLGNGCPPRPAPAAPKHR